MTIAKYLVTLFIFNFNDFVLSTSFFDENAVFKKSDEIPTSADLATQYGKDCEAFDVTTADGYILKIFHIPGNASRPVLLMHGILDSSDAFLARGEDSLAITLANKGYDVWLGNNRGNRYSRRHIKYNPDTDKEFWDYSFHEMGYYDLPSIIDFILDNTGQQKLIAFGHSEGTTIFFVMGSMKPEYNEKIKVIGALAPIAYLHHIRGLLRIALDLTPVLNDIVKSIQYEEFVGFNSVLTALIRTVCNIPGLGYELCAKTFTFPTIGFDLENLEPDFVPTLFDHFPSGTSRRTIVHFAKNGLQKRFAQYDFGLFGNLKKYNNAVAPVYDLSNVTMDVALFLGQNDFVSTIEDVELLRNQLPNVVDYQILEYDLWNHLDHLYARYMPKYLYPYVFDLLKKYN